MTNPIRQRQAAPPARSTFGRASPGEVPALTRYISAPDHQRRSLLDIMPYVQEALDFGQIEAGIMRTQTYIVYHVLITSEQLEQLRRAEIPGITIHAEAPPGFSAGAEPPQSEHDVT